MKAFSVPEAVDSTRITSLWKRPKIISSEQALALVGETIIKIRSDLNEYAVPYFNWVIENKSAR